MNTVIFFGLRQQLPFQRAAFKRRRGLGLNQRTYV